MPTYYVAEPPPLWLYDPLEHTQHTGHKTYVLGKKIAYSFSQHNRSWGGWVGGGKSTSKITKG